jgi:mono/diheme cytochrome c family protein
MLKTIPCFTLFFSGSSAPSAPRRKALCGFSRILTQFLLLVVVQATAVYAAEKKEPELTVKSSARTMIFKRSELLARKDLTRLEMDYDPLFSGKKMVYQGVPVYALFEGVKIPEDATIQYVCADGFAASIPRKVILNRAAPGAVAFLAIEKDSEKWPRIEPGKPETAGPFYLVWKNPKGSGISREGWPYHVTGFEVKDSLRASYPAIFPDASLPEVHRVNRGYQVFVKNCFVCHTMNRQGDATIGQSLRHYPGSRMHPFPKELVSDSELTDLISYLTHMSRRKVPAAAQAK